MSLVRTKSEKELNCESFSCFTVANVSVLFSLVDFRDAEVFRVAKALKYQSTNIPYQTS